AASTLLVWRLASALAPAASGDASDQRRLAFMVAVVFALHPVQTEAVTYVSGRSTSLAACFALLAIVLWLHGRERDDRRAGSLVHVDALNADPALPAVTASDAAAWLAAIVWAGLIAASLWSWRRHRTAAFSLLWFLLWLAPTNSLLPRLDVANDRQLYVALIGPTFGAAALLVRFARRTDVAMWVPMLMLVLGAAAWQRNRVYQDEIDFWADAATKSPYNARAFANLGHALADRGRAADAEEAFDVALQLDPRLHQAAINRQLLRAGEWPRAGAPAGACRTMRPPWTTASCPR